MIIALDVEEKAREKDAPGTSAQGASANIIVNKPTYKGKGKGKMNYGGKPKKTTNFKKKPERFVGGNFRRWQTRGLWVIHLVMPFTVEQTATFAGDSNKAL